MSVFFTFAYLKLVTCTGQRCAQRGGFVRAISAIVVAIANEMPRQALIIVALRTNVSQYERFLSFAHLELVAFTLITISVATEKRRHAPAIVALRIHFSIQRKHLHYSYLELIASTGQRFTQSSSLIRLIVAVVFAVATAAQRHAPVIIALKAKPARVCNKRLFFYYFQKRRQVSKARNVSLFNSYFF